MEGTCGQILSTDDPTVVIKKMYRRNRAHQRTGSRNAEEQARIQAWASEVCSRFKLLFVPRAWDAEKFQYKMERIAIENPLELSHIQSHPVVKELKEFYEAAKKEGLYPMDYELYVQADGRIAMIDFDKFAKIQSNGCVVFPWGDQLTAEQVKEATPF